MRTLFSPVTLSPMPSQRASSRSKKHIWEMLITAVTLCLLLLCPMAINAMPFTFTLAQGSKTSAGVFSPDGTLVKTLWSGVTYAAGTYTEQWDGTDDNGRLTPDGSYQIRVLSSNCTYTWEGVVGNTSDVWSGPSIYHFMCTINSMAITGTTAYFACSYNEGNTAQARFDTRSIGSTTFILGKGGDFFKVATDGMNVYWAGDDANTANEGFVMATAVGTDAQTMFQYGQPYTPLYGMTYNSSIDIVTNTAGAEPTGIAVQQTHPFLFVSHKGMNALHVLDKTTGQLVQSLTYTAPSDLAIDNSDNLWMIHTVDGARVVQHFTVNVDGTLSAGTVITGFSDPQAIACNGTVLVADGGASQQVKAFDVSGAPMWVLGQAGGYATDPVVTDDKFDFQPKLEYTGSTFLAFQPDGSFWVEDTGDYRTQHYAANRTFLNRIAYVPTYYSAAADPNDPTRVFANYLEYHVDYNLPLGPTNGSWTLARNWRVGVPAGYDNQYARMKCVTTLSNGRTYAFLSHSGNYSVFELPPTGQLRGTGVEFSQNTAMYPDGVLRTVSIPTGGIVTWTSRTLTGFDINNNPIWAAPTTLASAPGTAQDPVYWGDANPLHAGPMTTGNVVVSFDQKAYSSSWPNSRGWHLGGVLAGTNKWLWRASYSTPTNYSGTWPTDGTYDIMNGVGNAGGFAMAVDRHIIYEYRGEGWSAGQTNKFRHYYEDGLFVNEFGVTCNYGDPEWGLAKAGMAGNAYNCWLVKLADGRVYIYQNDESYHGGLHRWRIDGLNTVAEQAIDIAWTKDTQPGMQAEYFNTPDWNNRYRIATRQDSQVNFTWGTTPPAGTGVTSNLFSVRWTGFVTPQYSETYTFKAISDDYTRVWVDGQLVLSGAGTQSGAIALTAGVNYPIRVEYKNTADAASVSLLWSSASLPEEVIPAARLAGRPAVLSAENMVEGLSWNSELTTGTSGDYGWSYTLAPSYAYADTWYARTNCKTWQRAKPVDIGALFQKPGTLTATLARNLGDPNDATTKWEISAKINYDGNYINHGEYGQGYSGGQYLEVLDDTGKVIARMNPKQYAWPGDGRIIANNVVLLQTDAYSLQFSVMAQWQSLRITGKNGQITFQYGAYAPITTGIFDPTANWRRAKTLRLFYWVNNAGYRRTCYLDELAFSAKQPVATPDSYSTNEDTPLTVNAPGVLGNDSDPAGNPLTATKASDPAHGTVTVNSNGSFSYTPTADYYGPDSFTYTASNSLGWSATATVSLTVNAVNDAPSFTKGADQTVNENSGAQTVTGWATNIAAGPANESGQTVDFLVSNSNAALFSAPPAISPTGTLTYTPATNASGSATVTVRLHDDGTTVNGGVDTSAAQTFTITVVNLPPTCAITAPANNAVYPTAPATVAITVNAADPAGTVVKVEFFQGAALLGTDTNGADGWSYTWPNVPAGSYTITAKATDNDQATATSTPVNIRVNAAPAVSFTSPANGATITGSTVDLAATATDTDGTISKVEFYQGSTLLNTDTTAPYAYTWSGVAPGSYTLTAKAYDSDGAVTTSTPVTITVGSGWTSVNVGATGLAGSTTINGNTMTVAGAGAGIKNKDDAFRFVYKQLTGDCTIIARVASMPTTNKNARAGVVIRQDLTTRAVEGASVLGPAARSAYFLYRIKTGNNIVSTSAPATTLPYWVKVVRAGTSVKGYKSADGVTWEQIGFGATFAMTDPLYLGLAVSSGSTTATVTATFDNISITTP